MSNKIHRAKTGRVTGLCSLLLAASLGATPAWAENIKIGVVSPFSGDLASYGVPVRSAVELAAKAINDTGGINGQMIEIVAEDDVCEPNTASNVANKLVSEGVSFVVGHLCSGATKAALPIYKNANVLVISPASTNPDLTLDGANEHFFRTIAHDAAQANLQVDFATGRLNIKRAAVVHDKGDYGKGLAELVKAGLESSGVEVVLFEGITPGAADYSALISKFKSNGVNEKDTAIFFGGYHPEASKIITAARKARNNAKFISGDGVKDPTFVASAGRFALDYYATAPIDTSSLPAAIAVIADYEKATGAEIGVFSLQGYAAVQAFAQAIGKAGSTDYAAVRSALHSANIASPIGDISFDANGDVVGAGFAVYQVRPSFVAVE